MLKPFVKRNSLWTEATSGIKRFLKIQKMISKFYSIVYIYIYLLPSAFNRENIEYSWYIRVSCWACMLIPYDCICYSSHKLLFMALYIYVYICVRSRLWYIKKETRSSEIILIRIVGLILLSFLVNLYFVDRAIIKQRAWMTFSWLLVQGGLPSSEDSHGSRHLLPESRRNETRFPNHLLFRCSRITFGFISIKLN